MTGQSEVNPPMPSEDDLRDALLNAPEVEGPDPDPDPESEQEAAGGNAKRREGGRPRGEIFEGCPVVPLGMDGDFCCYLDVLGQLRAIKKNEAQAIQSLFGHQIPQLFFRFPQWRKADGGGVEKAPGKFDQNAASQAMYMASAECGVFNRTNAVRGVGAWPDEDGGLIYHMGDQVLVGGDLRPPGRIGKKIYPAQPAIPRPSAAENFPDPVPELMKVLETWNWKVPDVHPFIALGMIATQMICGALDWRPVFWLLAPAGAGKSEFQKLIKYLHGDEGLVQTTDATKSGITSKLGQSSLPVSVDELEPGDERSTKERDIIALARVAASGGEWFRGSADQTGVGGKVYSAFLFSSILIPGIMKTQDVQRLIRLEMEPLDKGVAKLNLQPRTWRSRGARMKRMLIDRWDTWPERLAIWRHALEGASVTGRDADNWGTVLAMADMVSNEAMPAEDVTANWAKKISFIAAAGRDETMNDAEAMLLHLMGQSFDIYRRGEQYTVAQWIMAAAGLPGAPEDLMGGDTPLDRADRRKKANSKLAKIGLRIKGEGVDAQLFIANAQIQGLKNMFIGTDYAGGVWAQSAGRIPGAKPSQNPLTLAGIRSRGHFVPVSSIPGLTHFPMDRDQESDDAGETPDGFDVDDWG